MRDRAASVFQIAVGVAALHALAAAFVTPNPSTTAGQHLAAGLVPAAVALAAGATFGRLPPGARALVALACGAPALAAGIALAPAAMALAGVAAGAALIGVAVLEGARALRDAHGIVRRVAAVIGTAFVGLYVIAPLTFAVIVTHRSRAVPAVSMGAPVALTTSDGLRLAASYVPSRNRAAVVVFPGRGAAVRAHARMLTRHGYGVLLLDRRGEGASEGDFNARGWDGEPDVVAAVGYLRTRPDVDPRRIGGLGLSVGGELLLQAAAHHRTLRAVVSEGAGLRSTAEQRHLPHGPRALRWLSPSLVETAATVVLGGHRPPPDLARLVGRIAPRPVLLIRALQGNPDEELNRIYRRAAPTTTELWELARGGHVGGLAADPRAYERRVTTFLDRALLQRTA